MTAKDFLEEIDYYNTNVEGQLYEELGIETLADMLEVYHQRKLNLLTIPDVMAMLPNEEMIKKLSSKYMHSNRNINGGDAGWIEAAYKDGMRDLVNMINNN